jgi:short-subunit dehydrogenase
VDKETKGTRTTLITGASGGIGLELARIFAREGYNLVLVARSADKLEQLAADLKKKHSVEVLALPKDLSDPSAPDEIYAQLRDAGIAVDVLVNNAGFTVFGPFVENDFKREQELMQVNIVALTHLTKLFLKPMVERGWGRVLNMGSTASFMPGPLMALYYASKAYVLYFSEALHEELDGTGVTVTALCPGPTATGFQQRGEMEDSRLVAGRQLMDVKTVAREGYKALMRGEAVFVPGRNNWLIAESIRFMPRAMVRRFIKRAQARVEH